MRSLALPALLSLVVILALSGSCRADTIFDYVATDVTVMQTPTTWQNDWTFNGPTLFTAMVFGSPFTLNGQSLFIGGANLTGDFPATPPAGEPFFELVRAQLGADRLVPYCLQCAPSGMANVWNDEFDYRDDGSVLTSLTLEGTVPAGTTVPEPASLLLVGSGVVGFLAYRKLRLS